MNGLNGVSGTTRVHGVSSSNDASSAGSSAPKLLPQPDLTGFIDIEDAVITLMAMQAKNDNLELKDVQGEVSDKQTQIKANYKKMMDAIDSQIRAESKKHGFWAKLKKIALPVAKIAAVVAAVAVTVASFGAAAPAAAIIAVAALALSMGGELVKDTKLFGKYSAWIGLGMEIGGAVLGFGGTLAYSAPSALSDAVSTTSDVADVANGIGTGAKVTSGLAIGAGAAADVKLAGYDRDAENALADQDDAQYKMQQMHQAITMLFNWLQSYEEAESGMMKTTTDTLKSCEAGAQGAIAGVSA
ncbi:MAG: hypothetical protein FWD73_01895 [Polyangiaceae bacterium]|nr:hypothetical protein [Polyangiaceae bacterium]